MADNSLTTKLRLIREVEDLKRIQQNLIESVQVCRRRMEIEKQFREKRNEYLKMMINLIDKTQASSVALNRDGLKQLINDEPNFGRVLLESSDKEEVCKLISQVDAKILRCSSIQYEAIAKFFSGELKDEKNLAQSSGYETVEEKSIVLQSDQEKSVKYKMDTSTPPELWADQWYEKFRRFTIVDEHGVPMPGQRKKTEQAISATNAEQNQLSRLLFSLPASENRVGRVPRDDDITYYPSSPSSVVSSRGNARRVNILPESGESDEATEAEFSENDE